MAPDSIQIQVGRGGWVRAFAAGVGAALYLRYEDRLGRLRLVDLFIEGTPDRDDRLFAAEARSEGREAQHVFDSELNTDLLRAIRLGEIEAAVNSPSVGEELRRSIAGPGPDLRTAAAAFRSTVRFDHDDEPVREHWVDDMLLSQVPGSGVRRPRRRTPEPPVGPRGRRYTLERAREMCRLEVPAKRPFGDDFYDSLAAAYIAISEWSPKPNVEIAEANGTTPGRVAKWVADARKRGALGPGKKGRRG